MNAVLPEAPPALGDVQGNGLRSPPRLVFKLLVALLKRGEHRPERTAELNGPCVRVKLISVFERVDVRFHTHWGNQVDSKPGPFDAHARHSAA